VAVAQLLVAVWALAPLTPGRWLRWSLGLALALHPWWVAGDVLRFLPAQVAVLSSVVWLGAAVRFIRSGSRWWLVLVGVAPLLGLLTYQAPALAILGGSVAVAVTTTAVRRGVTLVLATAATVGCVLLWSVVVAPRLAPASYEAQLLSGDLGNPIHLLRSALRTLALHGSSVVVVLVITAGVVVALGFAQRLAPSRAWVLLALIVGSPLAALAYASNSLQLNDPERLVLPVGVLLWLVLASVTEQLATGRMLAVGVIIAALLGSLAGSIAGYVQWSRYTNGQQELVEAAAAAREGVPADQTLVVADRSGRYGDVYLLLPPHLNLAVTLEHGPGAVAELCTVSGVPRDHPVAARFPLETTPDCSVFLVGQEARRLGSARTELGVLDFYAVPRQSG
jgi:hypothetical protein